MASERFRSRHALNQLDRLVREIVLEAALSSVGCEFSFDIDALWNFNLTVEE